MGDEHRGGLLHIVAPRMEERVESKLWATLQIIAFWTPRHFLFSLTAPRERIGIEAYAHGGILVECLYETVEAFFANHQFRLPYEILG
jgi:hypothetical protein